MFFRLTASNILIYPIYESFSVEYVQDNPFKVVVEQKWMAQSADEALQARKKELILPLFGEKAHQAFIGNDTKK